MPTQVWPALVSPPQVAASAAASGSASASTIIASLPPHSSRTGVSVCAHAAMIFLPVAVDPVNATLSTPAVVSAAPVEPGPKTTWKTGFSGTASAKRAANQAPTAGVYSLGLKTTALPAARAYPMDPSGV